MSISKIIAGILLLTIFTFSVSGQQDYYEEGLLYFEKGFYAKAIASFNRDKAADRNKDLLMKRVISNYKLNDLEAAKSDVPQLLSFKKPPAEVDLYIAKIYHAEGNFIKAANYYKLFLKGLNKDELRKNEIIHYIKQCHSGSKLRYKLSEADIQNPGSGFNSIFDDYGAIQSPNTPNKFYFNSNRKDSKGGLLNSEGIEDKKYGKFNSDIYSVQLKSGEWESLKPIPGMINTSNEEELLNISSNGQKLLYLKHNFQGPKQIFVNTYQDSNSLSRLDQVFESVIDPEAGDKYVFVCNDSLILYSSEQAGGYGGYDIYLTSYQLNGWTKGQNLGPHINSSADDVSPFLSKDGKQLYFSSNSSKSMGGLDIFLVERKSTLDQWSKPTNLGAGINSPQDDLYFRINSNGRFATLSSNRIDSEGGFDIYLTALLEKNVHMSGTNLLLFDIYKASFLLDYPIEIITSNLLVSNQPNSNATNDVVQETEALDGLFYSNSTDDIKTKAKQVDLEKKIFEVRAINSNSNLEITSVDNIRYLDSIISILNRYPEIKLEIDGHYVQEQLNENNLFFSVKRAETLAAYLQQKGIPGNRLILKGSGSNYPKVNPKNSTLNDRIEIKFHPDQIDNLRFMNAPSASNLNILNPSWQNYQEAIQELTYKVQITELDQLLLNPILKLYENGMIEKDVQTNIYKYSVGFFENYQEANELKNKLIAGGIEGSKIIPYVNGKRISNKMLFSLTKKYPDLVNYLQYSKQ